MNSFSKRIKEAIKAYKPNELIVAKTLYATRFNEFNENLFYKVLERLCKAKELKHIGKGIYVKPKISKYGEIPISDREIIEFYTKENKGIDIGYSLYNKKGVTTQTTNKYKILSNNIYESKKTIKNVEIVKVPFYINSNRKEALEILEILENYDKIEDANYGQLMKTISAYINKYDDKSLTYVIDNRKYKKSTIASLKHFLDKSRINNSLNKYLSPLSKYKLIKE